MMDKVAGCRRTVLLLATTVLTACVADGFIFRNAYAQTAAQIFQFNITAKPIRQSMNDIVRVTGIDVVCSDAIASSTLGQSVQGSLTSQQAIAALLAGTKLSYRFTNARSVVISGAVNGAAFQDSTLNASDSTVLDAITVSGANGVALGSHDDTYETAGSVNYISGDEIAQKRGTSVGDFLSGIPGVLNDDGRNSGGLDVNIRGMQGQGRVLIVIDGASQEQTVYR